MMILNIILFVCQDSLKLQKKKIQTNINPAFVNIKGFLSWFPPEI